MFYITKYYDTHTTICHTTTQYIDLQHNVNRQSLKHTIMQHYTTKTRNMLYITIHHKQNNIQYNKTKQNIKQYAIITHQYNMKHTNIGHTTTYFTNIQE